MKLAAILAASLLALTVPATAQIQRTLIVEQLQQHVAKDSI